MYTIPSDQLFDLLIQEGSTSGMVSVGPVSSRELFENVDGGKKNLSDLDQSLKKDLDL